MLQKAYLLAKIGADTAENEQHFAEIAGRGRPDDRRWIPYFRPRSSHPKTGGDGLVVTLARPIRRDVPHSKKKLFEKSGREAQARTQQQPAG